MLLDIFILFFITFCVHLIWTRRKLYWISWQLPGPLALPFIGNGYVYLIFGTTNFLELIPWVMNKYRKSKLVRTWLAGELTVIVSDATAAAQINKATKCKGPRIEILAKPLSTQGLFVDNNIPHWKVYRKVMAPVFHFKNLKHYIPIFHDESLILMEKLSEFSSSGESLYPPKFMELVTFSSIMRTAVGVNLYAQFEEPHPVVEALNNVLEHFQRKTTMPIFKNDIVYSLIGKRQEEIKDLKVLEDFVQYILERMKNSEDSLPRKALLELLLEHSDIPDDEIKAQLFTIISAGTDTSSHMNSVICLILAVFPEVQNKVYQELIEVCGSDVFTCPSFEDLMKLDYTERVIKECLRMFPSGFYVIKESTEEITISTDEGKTYTFPAGVSFLVLISLIHRSADYYENPLVFNPDRWLLDEVTSRNPFCFLPFSNGPRNCIAGKYAVLQMKAILSTVVRRYELLPTPGFKSIEDIKLRVRLTVSLQEHCRIKLRLRT